MQIYEKLILHLQIEQDFIYISCWQDGEKIFVQVQTL